MNEAAYQAWWQLHLRVAKGEELSQQERDHYFATLHQLEQAEILHDNTADIEQLQDQLMQAQAEGKLLRAYRQQLEAKLAELERGGAGKREAATIG